VIHIRDAHQGIREIAKQALADSIERGFDRPTWDNLPTKVMFAVTELQEACEDWSNDARPHSELADCVLRISAVLESLWPDNWSVRRKSPPSLLNPPAVLVHPALARLCGACQRWRNDDDQARIDVRIELEYALADVAALINAMGNYVAHKPPAIWACELRLRSNKTRPRLHGRRRPEA
jgi:hypothetical protein